MVKTFQARNLVLVLFAGLSMLLSLGASVAAAPAGDPPGAGLFTDSGVQGSIGRDNEPTILRTRYVDIRFDLLVGRDGLPQSQDAGSILVLNLFEDAVLTGILDRLEFNPSGGFTWLGHVEGVPLSQVTLVVTDRVMVGNVVMPAGFYQVRYAGQGVHVVYEIDPSGFPPEMEPIPVDIPEEATAAAVQQPLVDDGSVIDVLVAYTPAARLAEGGTQAMNALINLAVAETNSSYANSLINQRLNLVHTAEVSYAEADFSDALYAVTDPDDGIMDNVHTLRNTYSADEVVLLIHIQGSPYCGVAWLMSTVSTAFESNAFAVVHRECATGYYSFGHELGHNMGARHDWYVDSSVTPYAHSHGYLNAPDRWRTIMAYNAECSDRGVYCTRLQYWSNPNVTYGGDPMGVPEGSSTSCGEGVPGPRCDADNRKTLNKTAYTVANFRVSAQVPSAPSGLAATAVSRTQINLSWTDKSNDENGFKIERSPNGTAGWIQIATVGAGVTTYTNAGLTAGTTYYYRVRAYNQDGNSSFSNIASATTFASIVGPLVVDAYTIDDDTVGESDGNGNSRVDCGEAIELYVDLRNQGSDTVTGVVVDITTSDPYVSWPNNTSSDYSDIPNSGIGTNLNDFDIQISPGTPHGHILRFDLDIVAANGGPWSDSFSVPVFCSGPGNHTIYIPLVAKMFPPGFDSQFSGSAPGWVVHSGDWWIDADTWYTTPGLSDAWASVSYYASFANFDYQASFWRSGCDICANRLLVRGTPDPLASGYMWHSYYSFQYSRNGQFSVWKRVAGVLTKLQDWTNSSAINQDAAWNALRVVANGPNLYYYINGTLVWAGTDTSLTSGRVGFGMHRDANASGEQLWADWAVLSNLDAADLARGVSPEQQILNDAANERGGGSEDQAPRDD